MSYSYFREKVCKGRENCKNLSLTHILGLVTSWQNISSHVVQGEAVITLAVIK